MISSAAPEAGNPAREAKPPDALHDWKLLAPLPDKVGFGGMFAGVLNGRLVAAGGSQFPEKPLWLQGGKTFTDRIFTLAALDAKWVESSVRLPWPTASAASAATDDTIYFAGGVTAIACSRQVFAMRAEGDGFSVTPLPDLPNPIGYGAAAIVNQRLFVVGGLDAPTSKAPSADVWSLDLAGSCAGTEWRREPDLPGAGVFVTAAATDGRNLFVFGGVGFNREGKAVPSSGAHRLNVAKARWERLADLPEPRVGLSTPCPLVAGNKFLLAGGYASVFPGAPREHPGFSSQTFCFHPDGELWENGPVLPRTPVADRDSPGDTGPAPMIGAPAVVWRDHVVIIGGEVRSSVRTPAVLAWPLP